MSLPVSPQEAKIFPAISAARSEVRVLLLHPGGEGTPIVCTFEVTSLDDPNAAFEALSYAWDGQRIVSHNHIIYIGDNKIQMSATLHEALLRLRQRDITRRLWIDALCINQEDTAEKTQQVDMMGRIYTQCSQCNIWLGPLADMPRQDAERVVELICWLAGEASADPGWISEHEVVASVAHAFNCFMGLPWWSRIWTVQEAVLPSRATVYWGPASVSWQTMQRASDHAMGEGHLPAVPHEFFAVGAMVGLTSMLRGMQATRHEHIFLVLWRWRYRHASEPRDKVYALLGIRDDLRGSLPSVPSCDYAILPRDLFTRVSTDLIRQTLSLLPLIGRAGEISSVPGLPSWATAWCDLPMGSGHASFWDHMFQWQGLDYTADRGLFGIGEGLRMADENTLILCGLPVAAVALVEEDEAALLDLSTEDVMRTKRERLGTMVEKFVASGRAFHETLGNGQWMTAAEGLLTGKLVPANPSDGEDAGNWANSMLKSHKLFMTEKGHFGLGPTRTQPGHELWVVGGSRFPMLLERDRTLGIDALGIDAAAEMWTDFRFVSDAFVYGIMKGEAVEGRQQLEIRLH